MPDKSNCETPIDKNFIAVIEALNLKEIHYWVCHGTLLGLVRDQALIPWDHDIDIAVWAHRTQKDEIIQLMIDSGFFLKNDGASYDFLQFEKVGGREVDFNFYRFNQGDVLATSEWFIPRSRMAGFLGAMSEGGSYSGNHKNIIWKFSFLSGLAGLLVKILKGCNLFFKSAGYSTPISLLQEVDSIQIGSLAIKIPSRADEVLNFVYGADWRVPKPNYNWVLESPSTVVSNERFK